MNARAVGSLVRGGLLILNSLLATWVGAAATPAPAPPPGYFVRSWQTENGLPQNSVTAIVQTRDGYLWLGTYNGLARFDGVRFAVFDSGNTAPLQSSRITSLFEDSAGALWIGHETGDLTRHAQGRFEPVTVPGGWSGGKIVRISADESGDLWLLNPVGVLTRVRDGFCLPPSSGAALAAGAVVMERDLKGRLWAARAGEAGCVTQQQFQKLRADGQEVGGYAQCLCSSRDGGLWLFLDGRLRKWKDGQWLGEPMESAWGSKASAILELQSGVLAVATTTDGLYLWHPGGWEQHFTHANGLSHDWVRALAEDLEGNLWVAVGTSGLDQLRPSRVTVVEPPDHWQGFGVRSVCAGRDGAMWVGTEGAGLYRFQNGAWTNFSAAAGVSNLFVWSVCEDAQGRLWVGTWGGGLLLRQGDGFVRAPGLEDATAPMLALLPDGDGSLWIGTGEGLLRLESGRVTEFGRKQGLELPDVRAVAKDRSGTIWFGMYGGGLGRLKDGALRQFRKRDGLSCDWVSCLHPDEDGVLWIGTYGGGLTRLKHDHFVTISSNQGLTNNVICGIEEDGHGDFWLSSNGGILRVRKTELSRCADGEIPSVSCLVYGNGEGMPTLECADGQQPASCRTADGRLWFPTHKGLVSLDPTDTKPSRRAPPVVIEEVRADGLRLAVDPTPPAAALKVGPGGRQVEFRFTGLSFVVPERVRFRHQLIGWEPELSDAESARSVTYSYLPPGDYTFHVIACNSDGVWNHEGASLAFTVLPHFWQTWWLRLVAWTAGGAVVGVAMVFVTRRRMHQRLERLERQRAVERERTRIAKDIHDDLGASLTRITMLSQSARGDLDDRAQAAADLDRIYATARELTRAMDEIVWAVNPQHDTLDSLATYLGRFAQDFLGTAGVRCRLDVPMQLPAWPLTAEVRHNLFLAFKEALHNVVKHARASEVRVSLGLGPAEFSLCVEDNGRGLTRDERRSNGKAPAERDRLSPGNGLANMRRRLEEIGGRYDIESSPGMGTKARFTVPFKASAI